MSITDPNTGSIRNRVYFELIENQILTITLMMKTT